MLDARLARHDLGPALPADDLYLAGTVDFNAETSLLTILPETGGRVAEIFVKINDHVEAGAPLFRLDSSAQEATLEVARRKVTDGRAFRYGRRIW